MVLAFCEKYKQRLTQNDDLCHQDKKQCFVYSASVETNILHICFHSFSLSA